jgi:hypothetical protein
VGRHDPRSQPPTPPFEGEAGDELPGAEPVGVDPFSVEGFSVGEGDEEELDPRKSGRARVSVIRRRPAGLVLGAPLALPRGRSGVWSRPTHSQPAPDRQDDGEERGEGVCDEERQPEQADGPIVGRASEEAHQREMPAAERRKNPAAGVEGRTDASTAVHGLVERGVTR